MLAELSPTHLCSVVADGMYYVLDTMLLQIVHRSYAVIAFVQEGARSVYASMGYADLHSGCQTKLSRIKGQMDSADMLPAVSTRKEICTDGH